MAVEKPLPELNELNTPFWEAANEGQLKMQKCSGCGHIRYPISHLCPECLSEDYDWQKLSGRGSVFSSVVFHQVYHQAFKDEVPYNVSLIQLEEGPRMFSNVVGVEPGAVKIGQAVEVTFQKATDAISIPKFRCVG